MRITLERFPLTVAIAAFVLLIVATLVALGPRAGAATDPVTARYVFSHIAEKEGSTSNTQYTFDTNIYLTYADNPVSEAASATAKLYLYNKGTDEPARSGSGNLICSPCTRIVTPADPSMDFRIDALIEAKGGFASDVYVMWGLLVVKGDQRNLAIEGMLVNAHTSAFDVSMTTLHPHRVETPVQQP